MSAFELHPQHGAIPDSSNPQLRQKRPFWDGGGQYLGGLLRSDGNPHITNFDFYYFAHVICDLGGASWAIYQTNHDGLTGTKLAKTHCLLEQGRYLILGPCE